MYHVQAVRAVRGREQAVSALGDVNAVRAVEAMRRNAAQSQRGWRLTACSQGVRL